jgi:hypothetical protein
MCVCVCLCPFQMNDRGIEEERISRLSLIAASKRAADGRMNFDSGPDIDMT